MVSPALLTSVNQCWETPPDLFEYFHKQFNFTLDVCATKENAKLSNFLSPEDDGLSQSWTGHTCWMNPPYNPPKNACPKRCPKDHIHIAKKLPGQIDWVRKAFEESQSPDTSVIALLPARTDTKIFHDIIMMNAENVWFLRGRLKFVGAPAGAVFPSMVVKFASGIGVHRQVQFDTINTNKWKT